MTEARAATLAYGTQRTERMSITGMAQITMIRHWC